MYHNPVFPKGIKWKLDGAHEGREALTGGKGSGLPVQVPSVFANLAAKHGSHIQGCFHLQRWILCIQIPLFTSLSFMSARACCQGLKDPCSWTEKLQSSNFCWSFHRVTNFFFSPIDLTLCLKDPCPKLNRKSSILVWRSYFGQIPVFVLWWNPPCKFS